ERFTGISVDTPRTIDLSRHERRLSRREDRVTAMVDCRVGIVAPTRRLADALTQRARSFILVETERRAMARLVKFEGEGGSFMWVEVAPLDEGSEIGLVFKKDESGALRAAAKLEDSLESIRGAWLALMSTV